MRAAQEAQFIDECDVERRGVAANRTRRNDAPPENVANARAREHMRGTLSGYIRRRAKAYFGDRRK